MDDPIIIGIDPAAKASGWAALQGDRVISADVFTVHGTMTKNRVNHLSQLYAFALSLCKAWKPALLAIESVHHGPSPQTTMRLAEVGAAILLAAHHAGIRHIVMVSPAERCQALGLEARASKEEVLTAVNRLFGLALTDYNAADAVAIGVAGQMIHKAEEIMGQAT